MSLTLHGYWRSTTAYRVRIALALKGIAYEQVPHDLRTGAQRKAEYRTLNPQGLVPALETDDVVLTQSPAILEWIDEVYPDPPLLPAGANDRAIVRAMAATVACDIHPVNNLRILNALRTEFGADEAAVNRWIARWIGDGFAALETQIARYGDGFAFGATPTIADCHLIPQLYSAERFAVDLSPYPHLKAAADKARALPAFAAAHPDRQPDADPA
ncbi:maleylpyruvate isomerase [Sphingomonas sp. PP-F2F-A104-K0414]|uniref:maleylacetoacetate isomerase n=1 Tax=Sphingomonas sp. PP-F2F-A104-K0414 TaxID=2135661 RepID=UPI001051CABA|nr:maleylacetoacetate isomerase [Sphingomonas sp. PP-F2F-A104-K0414]TCP98477.1 maleylpyruvate isomerase [Sphingomonas sp. PP-F2F-A104-K0414]